MMRGEVGKETIEKKWIKAYFYDVTHDTVRCPIPDMDG